MEQTRSRLMPSADLIHLADLSGLRIRIQRIAVVALIIAGLVAIALPAVAAVYDEGSKNCHPNIVGIQSKSTGFTTHIVEEPYPEYITGQWLNGGSATIRRSTTSDTDVYWVVQVDGGTIWDIGTHGYCTHIE